MFPEGFIKRIHDQKYIDAGSLLKALEEPSPVSIRINPFKWNKSPSNSESVPWCKNGYYIGTRPSYTLDPLFHSGCYYPQEASGMFLEQAILQTIDSLENIRVLGSVWSSRREKHSSFRSYWSGQFAGCK